MDNINPTNIIINTYNKIASRYTDEYYSDSTDLPFIDKFLDFLPTGSSVLDVGCGPGQFSLHIQNRGFNVTGIDLSDAMLSIARQKTPQVRFKKMNMLDLKFSDETFAGVLSSYSLIHIPRHKVKQALLEFHRVLKPNGYLALIVQKGKSDQIVDESFMPSEKMFFNFFQSNQLLELLKQIGFQIILSQEEDCQDPDTMSDKIIYIIAQKQVR